MDIIADALTRIRNAIARKFPEVEVKKSGVVKNILDIMKKEGFIEDFFVAEKNPYFFTIKLKYFNGKSVITGIKRISKLGRRFYVSHKNLPRVYNNFGIAIVSTSKGVLTDREARELGVGGEVICYIW
ncbi:MAG: 30S ribosomal protein S8 [Brevinematales bacterium]|nr:30S ribosomal protein S8 [Brevinematales bacterium]